MALTNVISSGGYLLAEFDGGIAISELITQELVDNDFVEAKNTRSLGQHSNISSITSTADTLITSNPLTTGSRIIIRKNDGTFNEMIVSTTAAVTNAGQIPVMWGNTTPRGTASAKYTTTNVEPWRAFDKDSTSYSHIGGSASNGWVEYRNENDELIEYSSYYIHATGMSTPDGWTLQGSTNGVDWTNLDVQTATSANGVYSVTQNQAPYSRYRIFAGDTSVYVYKFDLLGDGVSIDTSAITAGETPDQVYVVDDKISFNDQLLTESAVTYEYGVSGERLFSFKQYDDIVIPDDGSGDGDGSRTCTTKVEFSAAGNLITEITGDLWEAVSPPPPFSVSKATAVGNAVTVYFPSDVDIEGDLLTCCTVSINSGVGIVPDTITPNSDFIVLNIPADSIIIGDTVDFIYTSTPPANIIQSGTANELMSGTYAAINSLG